MVLLVVLHHVFAAASLRRLMCKSTFVAKWTDSHIMPVSHCLRQIVSGHYAVAIL